jgi:acyl-lipid omega-6 desaturase (Delta-12 desaturase)
VVDSAASPTESAAPRNERMRTGKELILAAKPFAEDHSGKSWWCVLSTATLLLASIAGTLWNFHPVGKIICSILEGLLILRFFVIYHDQQHHAILPNSRLAAGLVNVFGILVLSPSTIWTSSHNHHHNHNSKLRGSHIGSFPVMTKEQFFKSQRSERAIYLFMRHPLTILFGYVFIFLHGMCVYPFFTKPRKHPDCLVAFLVHIAIAVALNLWVGWQGWLLTQVIPHLIASAIGSYLFYAQHNFPDVTLKESGGWTYEGAALESSSFMKTNPLMAWFTGNIGYHHIHHLNSRIPFYRLPEVLKKIPELQSPKLTSLDPREIYRCLRLKLWDTESQRMITMPRADESPSAAV